MKDLLISRGWIFDHSCHCGGVYREYFFHSSHPGMTMKIFPNKLTYKVTKGGKRMGEGPAATLENYLNGLVA